MVAWTSKERPLSSSESYYTLLGISPDAMEDQIDSAYRRLSKACHPDAGASDAEMFRKITDAYKVLSIPSERNLYDQRLQDARVPPKPRPSEKKPAGPPESEWRSSSGSRTPPPSQEYAARDRHEQASVSPSLSKLYFSGRSYPLLALGIVTYLCAKMLSGINPSALHIIAGDASGWLFLFFFVLPKSAIRPIRAFSGRVLHRRRPR
jgi:curved DNA-binding protein CbpA